MSRPHTILSEAENDYPNRLPNEAQVPPVSTGGTLANVRSKDEAVDGRHILRSGSGFRSEAVAPDRHSSFFSSAIPCISPVLTLPCL